MVVIILFLFKN